MPLPTWDVFIGLAFLVGIAYGFIIRRDKTITTLCSVYIGLVIASNFATTVFDFFHGNSTIANQIWIRSNASLSTISIVLFLASIFFVSGAINSSSSKSSEISPIEVLVYSSLTIALIVGSILSFIPPDQRAQYITGSILARNIFTYLPFITVAAPLLLVALNARRNK